MSHLLFPLASECVFGDEGPARALGAATRTSRLATAAVRKRQPEAAKPPSFVSWAGAVGGSRAPGYDSWLMCGWACCARMYARAPQPLSPLPFPRPLWARATGKVDAGKALFFPSLLLLPSPFLWCNSGACIRYIDSAAHHLVYRVLDSTRQPELTDTCRLSDAGAPRRSPPAAAGLVPRSFVLLLRALAGDKGRMGATVVHSIISYFSLGRWAPALILRGCARIIGDEYDCWLASAPH